MKQSASFPPVVSEGTQIFHCVKYFLNFLTILYLSQQLVNLEVEGSGFHLNEDFSLHEVILKFN